MMRALSDQFGRWLAGLALLASSQSLPVSLALLAIGGLCVTALIRDLQRDRRKP